jgi:hypothetical protein
MPKINLPEIIELSHYRGSFNNYLQAVYDIFVNDFINTKPTYRGTRLGLKRFPIVDGKEYTFYHFTHSGDIESERIPDMRRMEAIPWPKPIIDDSVHPDLRVWQNIRRGTGGTKSRILILHESTNYLVILDKRDTFILPWTAYFVGNKQKAKLIKEYESYIKAETAKN